MFFFNELMLFALPQQTKQSYVFNIFFEQLYIMIVHNQSSNRLNYTDIMADIILNIHCQSNRPIILSLFQT